MVKRGVPSKSSFYDPIETRQSSISFIWLLPLIALVISGWLIYKNFIEEDFAIKIHFDSGSGLVAGKTKLKHKGVHIGVVSKFQLDDDLKGVTATIIVDKNAESALREDTRFWLVEPRISTQGISGLETLVAGSYISMIPGHGKFCYEFQGLKEPPPLPSDEPGLHLTLQTNDLGSIHQGAPVHFRKMIVGDVQNYNINSELNGIDINIHIKKEYKHLVKQNARFWNCSGISFSGDLNGFKFQADSLASILSGGISFFIPENSQGKPIAANGDKFKLYDDYKTADAGILVRIAFDSADGLIEGKTKVLYKGLEAGVLKKINLNKTLDGIIAEFCFVPKAGFALNESARFWLVKPRISFTEVSGLETILSGNYIEMSCGKGKKSIRDFVILSEAPPVANPRPGLKLKLKSFDLGSIGRGTTIYYRKIPVGKVLDFHLASDNQSILMNINIEKPYERLINKSTRFWNTSGISVKGDFSGLDIRTESIESIIWGGLAFFTPDQHGARIKKNHIFELYSNYDSAKEIGIPITIYFKNGEGLKENTIIKYRGIKVGIVKKISADKNLSQVVVKALLNTVAKKLAIEGTKFWMVRPRLGLIQAANLETLVTGQYIAAIPGDGKAVYEFTGLEKPPVVSSHSEGLDLVLIASTLGSLKEGSGVYYREVPVGTVSGYRLATSSDKVLVYINIDKAYASLVYGNTRFWNVSGVGIDFSFFKGAKVRMESVESMLAGGVAFATPNRRKGLSAKSHMKFELYDKPKESWLKWVSVIKPY